MGGEHGNRLGVPDEFLRHKEQFSSLPVPVSGAPSSAGSCLLGQEHLLAT